MRVVCGIFAMLLLAFAVVQWNDPDPVFWAAVYGAGALWCGIAAFSPGTLGWTPARVTLLATAACAVLGVAVFWPDAERWWAIDVWWPERSGETSREAMGMMVVAAGTVVAALVGRRRA